MRFNRFCDIFALSGAILFAGALLAYGEAPAAVAPGDRMLSAYFESQTRRLADACLTDIKTAEDWKNRRELYRRQLSEMLGLDPLPERTPLEAVVTGTIEHEDFIVEKLHFQSRPRLYVTANLYIPKSLTDRAPAILYVCGHSPAKENGVSFGNKTRYQHHAGWFARHGYVCLVVDTLQLGEIEGLHHGTYRENMWWWNSRGYTPAGVETWNAIRALDYLQSRPEVDTERIGMMGRSGGGATTWWAAALDDRVKVAVPVAGITNLKNHVVDGCVEGHCDCMYVVNTYGWDYGQVAALVAPRPLLLSNTDHDTIFPLDGVLDVYGHLRRLYELHGKPEHLGLNIAAGPHEDTQPLQVHAFQWFNHFLKGESEPIAAVAESLFEIEELKVFDELPADEVNTRAHEVFTTRAEAPDAPATDADWKLLSSRWRRELREKCFGGWPDETRAENTAPELRRVFDARAGGVQLTAYDFDSQENVTLRLFVVHPIDTGPSELESLVLHPLDAQRWTNILAAMQVEFSSQLSGDTLPEPDPDHFARITYSVNSKKRAHAYFTPRGIGPTAWNAEGEKHIRRRFMLLGQTVAGMRVWDARQAVRALQKSEAWTGVPLWLDGQRDMAGVALYTALFEPDIARLQLRELPKSHQNGPDFLNVLRILDMPQTVAMVAEHCELEILQTGSDGWNYPLAVAENLDWKKRVTIHDTAAESPE